MLWNCAAKSHLIPPVGPNSFGPGVPGAGPTPRRAEFIRPGFSGCARCSIGRMNSTLQHGRSRVIWMHPVLRWSNKFDPTMCFVQLPHFPVGPISIGRRWSNKFDPTAAFQVGPGPGVTRYAATGVKLPARISCAYISAVRSPAAVMMSRLPAYFGK